MFPEQLRIVIIEDQRLIRESFALAIAKSFPQSTIRLFASCSEALHQNGDLSVADLLLLDLQLEDEQSHDHIPVFRQQFPRLRILIVTGLNSEFDLHTVAQQTPEGFIHKGDPAEMLIEAIRTVAGGGRFISPRVVALQSRQRQDPRHFTKIFTPREQAALRLIGQGLSNEEAAALLGVSPGTVQTHRRNLMRKLDLHRTTDLIAYAIKTGFVPPHTRQSRDDGSPGR